MKRTLKKEGTVLEVDRRERYRPSDWRQSFTLFAKGSAGHTVLYGPECWAAQENGGTWLFAVSTSVRVGDGERQGEGGLPRKG